MQFRFLPHAVEVLPEWLDFHQDLLLLENVLGTERFFPGRLEDSKLFLAVLFRKGAEYFLEFPELGRIFLQRVDALDMASPVQLALQLLLRENLLVLLQVHNAGDGFRVALGERRLPPLRDIHFLRVIEQI